MLGGIRKQRQRRAEAKRRLWLDNDQFTAGLGPTTTQRRRIKREGFENGDDRVAFDDRRAG